MNALLYFGRRILSTIPILVLVGLITFLLIHLTPGDPAAVVAGDNASVEAIEAARHRLGLDQPFLVQFWHWLHGVVSGDLGTSFTSGRPVVELILDRLPITLSLTAGATLVGLGISVPLGVFAALRRGSWADRTTIFATSLGIAAPEFFIGLLLVLVVALELGWLPATGYVPFADDPIEWVRRLILPSLTLGLGVAAELARQVRGAMIDVLSRDYIQTARAKGLSALSIIVKHGLKNAAIPVVTVLGLQIRRLLGGAVIVEQIFAMNGVGSLAVRAVFLRDLPVLLGVALITAVVVLFVNLLVDMSYSYFDPESSPGMSATIASPLAGQTPAAAPVAAALPPTSTFVGRFCRNRTALVSLIILLLIVLVAVCAPLLAPHNPARSSLRAITKPPSLTYLLGTDDLGRDVLSRLIFASRLSLLASVQAVAIALTIGLPLGLISGYVGGWVDTIIMRFNDALMSFPALILAVVIVGMLGPSLSNAMTAIGLVYAPRIMRVVRGSTLSVRQEVYITAARATGCGDARIITKHVLPNVMGPLVVQATVLMGQALLAEAGLSFLGLGVQPPEASWGAILGTAFPFMAQSPVPTIAAGTIISVTVLCFNLVGDGIRDSVGRMRRAGD